MTNLGLGTPPLFGIVPVGAIPVLLALAMLAWRSLHERWLPWLGPMDDEPSPPEKWTPPWMLTIGSLRFRIVIRFLAANMIAQVLFAIAYAPVARLNSILVCIAGCLLFACAIAHPRMSTWASTLELIVDNAWRIAGTIALIVVFYLVKLR